MKYTEVNEANKRSITSAKAAPPVELSLRDVTVRIQPGKILDCSTLKLTSLDGAPIRVSALWCDHNDLKSLEHCPSVIQGDFNCDHNRLTSLEHCPSKVGGNFSCSANNIKSLKGVQSVITGSFWCDRNVLTDLDGAPTEVDDDFIANGNKLTTLQGIHKHIKHIGGHIAISDNPITSHVLGLLMIDGLKGVEWSDKPELESILNKHLNDDRDVFACQEELIEAGFPEYAKL